MYIPLIVNTSSLSTDRMTLHEKIGLSYVHKEFDHIFGFQILITNNNNSLIKFTPLIYAAFYRESNAAYRSLIS